MLRGQHILKKCTKLNQNFRRGWWVLEKIPSLGGGVSSLYFLELHSVLCLEIAAIITVIHVIVG